MKRVTLGLLWILIAAPPAIASQCFTLTLNPGSTPSQYRVDILRTCPMSQFLYGWRGVQSVVVTCCPERPNPYPVEIDMSCTTVPEEFWAGDETISVPPPGDFTPVLRNIQVGLTSNPANGSESVLEFDYEFPHSNSSRDLVLTLLARAGRPARVLWRKSPTQTLPQQGHISWGLSPDDVGAIEILAKACGTREKRIVVAANESCQDCEEQSGSCHECEAR